MGLLAAWFAFSASASPYNIASGVLAGLLAVIAARKLKLPEGIPLSPGLPLYWLWLLKEITVSSARVVGVVLSPKLDIAPVLVPVATSQKTPLGIVIYANSITLTPGTVCIDIEGDKLLVHSLFPDGIEQSHEDNEMDKRIGKAI